MLTYGGIALVLAGIVTMLFNRQLGKDAETRARMRKQAPWLIVVGAVFLVLAYVLT